MKHKFGVIELPFDNNKLDRVEMDLHYIQLITKNGLSYRIYNRRGKMKLSKKVYGKHIAPS